MQPLVVLLLVVFCKKTTSFSSSSHADDNFFRWMRQHWPLTMQYGLRDSGMLRTMIDTLSMVTGTFEMERNYPHSLRRLYRLSMGRLQRIRYGQHSAQVVDLLEEPEDNEPLVVFVHGGAWGSGTPLLYRLVDINYPTAVVGYRTYPDADMPGQMQDVQACLKKLHRLFPSSPLVLVGHSSGAHIGMLAVLRNESPIAAFCGIAGVYDLPSHYLYEKSRGVERISPLAPAGGGTLASWRRYSPLRVLETTNATELPPIALIHGEDDTTVPFQSSVKMAKALEQHARHSSHWILPGVQHAETAIHLMVEGPTLSMLSDWLSKQSWEVS